MKPFPTLILMVTLLTGGCGLQYAAASWAFPVVKWHNHIYKVTSRKVLQVGQQVGTVTSYSTDETAAQTGTFSNTFPVGTRIFQIPSTDTGIAIAVQTEDGSYVEAIDMGPSGSR